MVRTRSGARGFLFDRLSQERQYELEELARQFDERQSQSQDNGNDMCDECEESQQSEAPTYNQNDACKRHRKPDSQPYSVDVVQYRRRKPH